MQDVVIIVTPHSRYLNWATFAVAGALYLLSVPSLPGWPVRVAAGVLVLAFCVLQGLEPRLQGRERLLQGSFLVQATLLTALIALPGEASDLLTFLFFLLTVDVATSYAARPAALWTAAFALVVAIVNIARQGEAGVVVTFDTVVFLMCAIFGQSLRQAELARRRNLALLEELRAAQQQLQELALAEERNRMAREIHDGLGHYLTATTLQIQGARAVLENSAAGDPVRAAGQATGQALGALGKAESLLQEALADVRRSVSALRATSRGATSRATPLPDRPLATILAELVGALQADGGPEAHLATVGTPRTLNAQATFTLFRVAQEALTNVRKHAQARRVDVVLTYAADRVRLEICDDGRGQSMAGGGFGLLGLRERVHLLGGAVKTETAPGEGFRLEVEVPA